MFRTASLALFTALACAAPARAATPPDPAVVEQMLRLLIESGQAHYIRRDGGAAPDEVRLFVYLPPRPADHAGVCESDSFEVVAEAPKGKPPGRIRHVATERSFVLYDVLPRDDPTPTAERERRCAEFGAEAERFSRSFSAGEPWIVWVAGQMLRDLTREAKGPDAGPLAQACARGPRACPSAGELKILLRPEAIGGVGASDIPGARDEFELRVLLHSPDRQSLWWTRFRLRRAQTGGDKPKLLSVKFQRAALLGDL